MLSGEGVVGGEGREGGLYMIRVSLPMAYDSCVGDDTRETLDIIGYRA